MNEIGKGGEITITTEYQDTNFKCILSESQIREQRNSVKIAMLNF